MIAYNIVLEVPWRTSNFPIKHLDKLMMKTYIWESLIQMLVCVCMNMIQPIKEESIPIVLPSYYAFIDVIQYLVSFNL